MAVIEIRKGTYYDSVTLMQLQASLMKLPGISNAGVMMGTAANKDLLRQSGLLNEQAEQAGDTDLIIGVEADDETAVDTALSQVDNLLSHRRSDGDEDYMPKTLAAASRMLPAAKWVLVSVPGSYAAGVSREALALGKHVFLYSDNVSLEDEVALKNEAAQKGLLVMGPDCGTAIINGVGFGFANKVRRGAIGLVGASGTGLQQVTAHIHRLGSGITHAIGTGGRDLSASVGGITALQAMDLLLRDSETRVIILISKPPDAEVVSILLQKARAADKPVVINFIGYPVRESKKESQLHFAGSLEAAAKMAVSLVHSKVAKKAKRKKIKVKPAAGDPMYLRGLFAGGTLAYETLLVLQDYLPNLYSNIPLKKEQALNNSDVSQEHTILDLGEDEFTVGRPHPMLDNTLRLERLRQEASDPEVGLILLDVVLGYGAHHDPASELAPAISKAISSAKKEGRELEVVALVVGTDEDPQDFNHQIKQLEAAGARIETSIQETCQYVGERLQKSQEMIDLPSVDTALLDQPLQAINVGLESFTQSLRAQETTVVHVDWRPPAGGNEKLMSILERMKKK